MPISIPDDRAVSGVSLKPTLEFGLLRSEVLTARGYPEVDGDGPVVHPAIMYDFIGPQSQTRPAVALTALACKIAPNCLTRSFL